MRTLHVAIVLSAASVVPCNPARAACPDPFGRWGFGQMKAVATAGTIAYAGSGTELLVLDVATPAAPAILRRLSLPGVIRDIAVSGDRAYVADNTGGVRVLDISDPAYPAEIGFNDTSNRVQTVAADGSHVFAVSASNFLAFDVSAPGNPVRIASLLISGSGRDMALAGGYAFVAADAGDLQVVDVSDPAAPVAAGSLSLPGYAASIAVRGGVAYVGTTGGTLEIVDVSTPPAPALLASAPTTAAAQGLALQGNLALVAADSAGIRLIDVTNPASPTEIGHADTPGKASGIALAGAVALVADESQGLRVLDVSAPAAPTEVSHLDSYDDAQDVALAGTLAYVADGLAGLRILDVSDPAAPAEIGGLVTGGEARGVAVSGGLAYLVDSAALRVIDVADPAAPTLLGTTPLALAREVAVAGTYAFVAGDYEGLVVVDAAAAAAPYRVATVKTPGNAYAVALAGDLAYVAATTAGLAVYDVTVPASPLLLGSLDTPGSARGVAAAGALVYVADGDGGLRTVDVSDPAQPLEVASAPASYAEDVSVAGDRLLLADNSTGLRVYSLAAPTAPQEVGMRPSAWVSVRVDAAGDLVAVADLFGGVAFFDASGCPTGACSLTCSASALPAAGPAPLAVAFAATVTPQQCSAPVTYRWELGDGSPAATAAAFSHTYAAGTWTWSLTADSGAASCTAGGTITAQGTAISVLDGTVAITSGQAAPVSLGTVVRGSAGAPRTLTVRNDGATAVILGPVTLPPGFALAEGLAADLAPGATDTFTIRLDTAATGDRSGALAFTVDGAANAPFTFTVSGSVAAPPPRRFDFGTPTSNLAAGYARATAATMYAAATGWGWLPATLTARDRSGSFTDLTRDLVYSGDATFVVDLPNGAWDVTLTMGDGTYPHDQMGVSLEGVPAPPISTVAGQFVTRVLRAAVADNQLALCFHDLGGTDTAVVVNGLAITPAPPRRFDFGTATSPVATGYARVTEATAYDAFRAHGWSAGTVQSRDRGAGGDLGRDLNFAAAATFLVDIADGSWDVTVVMGDAAAAHDQMGIAFEGGAPNLVSTARGQVSTKTYRIAVADGQLTVALADTGGADPNVVLNALAIAPAAYRFDFGTATSPVAAGYQRVTGGTTYSPARGSGWLAGTVGSRDRAVGTDLLRDLNFTPLATFALDVPAGSWDVTVTIADAKAAHDEMGFLLEGVSAGTVTLAAGETRVLTSRVEVADGQLTLLLDDLGGSDANVVINGLEVVAAAP